MNSVLIVSSSSMQYRKLLCVNFVTPFDSMSIKIRAQRGREDENAMVVEIIKRILRVL